MKALEQLEKLKAQEEKLQEQISEIESKVTCSGLFSYFRGRKSFLAEIRELDLTDNEKFEKAIEKIQEYLSEVTE